MYRKRIVCLANSRKPPSGRCVAGKEYEGRNEGQWIRPVSSREGREVSEDERRYENGAKAQLLDIVTIPLEREVPAVHQTENHLLAEDFYWVKEGRADWKQVLQLLDSHDSKFWEGGESTNNGALDKVAEGAVGKINSSLKLIHVPKMRALVRLEEGFAGRPGRRRVRGGFEYQGRNYLLSITDPEIEETFLLRGNGEYEVRDAILCISLTELWNRYAYRLIASVITKDRF